MKNILIPILIGFTFVSFAQNEPNYRQKQNEYTPEQQAIINTKQMVLQLDLNKFQESQLLVLNEKRADDRQKLLEAHRSMKESDQQLSSDEKFNRKNEMLDAQIKYQADIKKILEVTQFEEWRKTKKRNYSMQKRKMHGEQKQKQKQKMKNK